MISHFKQRVIQPITIIIYFDAQNFPYLISWGLFKLAPLYF